MRIYLMRHGEAVPPGALLDDDRPLTDRGRGAVRRLASAWSGRGDPIPEAWLVSPLVRAVQTCEICVGAFEGMGPVEIHRSLLPEERISVLVDLIHERGESAVALVGHQPLIGGTAAFLLGWASVPANVEPGAVLAIDLPDDGGAGRLVWHAVPGKDERGPLFLQPEPAAP